MKKLLIMLFLLATLSTFSQDINILNTFYAHDLLGNEIKVHIIEHRIYKGFVIDNGVTEPIYMLTEKNKYNLTVKNDCINYTWYTWKNISGEMLIITTPIFCLTSMDWQTGLITFVFNLNLYDNSTINNYFIQFERKYLK